MSQFTPIIPEDSLTTPKNRFPIVLQLVILAVILGSLFGSLLWQTADSTQVASVPSPAPVNSGTIVEPITISHSEVAITAEAAYVWDVQGQRALYSKNSDTVLPLASITKLMTSLLAHELLSDQIETTVSVNAIRQEGSSGLTAGERLTMNDLHRLALISSSNDAAYELSASVGSLLGSSQNPSEQFVTGMNIRAEELGLETLSFSNTTGLDLSSTQPGAVGSARDVSFLMEYIILQYPDLLLPTTAPAARVYNEDGAFHDINNTNPAIQQIPNLLGSKTGYTDLAGGNLTIAFDAGLNRPIIITVLGSTQNARFTDVLTLVTAVQNSLTTTNLTDV